MKDHEQIEKFLTLQRRYLAGEKLSSEELTEAGKIGGSGVLSEEHINPRFKNAVSIHWQTKVFSWDVDLPHPREPERLTP